MELRAAIPSESGHFYLPDGTPYYEVVGKNGSLRKTTLRDARKVGALPSVTTILKSAASPGLERWKLQNTLLAALTLPRNEGEDLDSYAERVIADSREQQNKAMDLGTSIHASLEQAYLGEAFDVNHIAHVTATREALEDIYGVVTWVAEASFAHSDGYGGKIDIYSPSGIVVDFKTKAFDDESKVIGYDEHVMQLAAYGRGLEEKHPMLFTRAANVFISTTTPGLVKVIQWSEDDLERGWDMFSSLLTFWKAKNRV